MWKLCAGRGVDESEMHVGRWKHVLEVVWMQVCA